MINEQRHCRRPRARRPLRSWAAVLGLAAAAALGAVAGPGRAGDAGPGADDAELTGAVTLAADENEVLPAVARPFSRGERLKFTVQYGFVNAGTAYLEIPEVRTFEGRAVFTLVARAESNSFFDRIYKVENRIESLWDTSGHYSRRYAENRREGRYRAKNEIVFDYERREAVYGDGRTFPIPPQVQDALSSFYYTRFQALPLGGSLIFDYHASRKSLPLEVKVLGRQRIETPAGVFDCVVIEPILKAGGIFKNKGRLAIWLTDDARRMPVMMKSKVMFGSISALLVEARPGV